MNWKFTVAILIGSLQATYSLAQKLDIKSQRSLTVQQGQSITISLSDITVEADKHSSYPNGFYIQIDHGENYTVSGQTITPLPTFTGRIKAKIKVTNGKEKSDKFNLEIEVAKRGEDNSEDAESGGGDQKPVIVNQLPVTINKNQSFKITLNHLIVSDPDNSYPSDFTLKVQDGNNYTVSEATVTPALNFVGSLVVKVKVNDGKKNSEVFDFIIKVNDVASVNVKPVITAHAPLSTFKNEALAIPLSSLSVIDPDDKYPTDFTLVILEGPNYSASGNTIIPAASFVGTLTVKVKVNDGTDDSNVFDVKVKVVERGTLQILGQSPIVIQEDSPYSFKFADLQVSDPSDTYPSGFGITLLPGDHYTFSGNTITPEKDFHGNLIVALRIEKAAIVSNIFESLVIVEPVNDPPMFSTFDSSAVAVGPNAADVQIAREVVTGDTDNEKLAYAEIQLDTFGNQATLSYTNTENIRGIFDQQNGVLVFLGEASLAEYDQALTSVTYSSNDSTNIERSVTFRLNDGQAFSKQYVKKLIAKLSELFVDIPNAFTPNGDNANDTWNITLLQQRENMTIDLKVYNKNGALVFQTNSLTTPWDGRFSGEVLPLDSYFYTIEVTSLNRRERRKGIVAILR